MTGAGLAYVSERGRGVWKEDVQDTEQAILIQFTNEARPGDRNVGGLVKAELVYKNEAKVLRITWTWLNAASDHTKIPVTQSTKLILSMQYSLFMLSLPRPHPHHHP